MLRFIIIFIAFFLISIPHWIVKIFGVNVTTDQIFFHLFAGRNALIGTDFSVYESFFYTCFIDPLVLAMLFALALHIIYLKTEKKFFNNKLFRNFYSAKTDFFFLFAAIIYFGVSIHIQYLLTNFGEDSLTPIYANPAKITYLKPQHKKNLLYIYVESLEYNLRNPKLQGSNLIEAVDQLDGINMFISPAPGTGWTIAGMVSSQCSFPLKEFFADTKITQTMFYPGAVCLGDILKQQGYTQYYLVGPDLKFADMDKFYFDHGYNYSYGLNEWKKMGLKKDRFTSWGKGLSDDALFEEATKIIENKALHQQPYNITIMTTDSHFPNGFPSKNCSDHDKTTGFQGAFHCTSETLAHFINNLKSKNLLNNTVVIIMGDHHFMNSAKQEDYFPKPRYVYFKIIDPVLNKTPTRKNMTHFDVAPTILDLLGLFNGQSTQFGLGVSIFSNISADNYSKLFDEDTNENILNRSKTYDSFWVPK